MKLTAVLLLAAFLQVSANGLAQSVTYSGKNVALENVFASVEEQTGYLFFYNGTLLRNAHMVSISAKNVSLESFLQELLKDQPLEYTIKNKTIVIGRKATPVVIQSAAPVQVITGLLKNKNMEPLPFASVRIKNSKTGVNTDANGRFSINANIGDVLVFTYVGYGKGEVKVTSADMGIIMLKAEDSRLDEVQITAYGQTTKRLTTSDIFTVKGEDIAKSPVTNVLEALQGRVPGMFVQQQSGQPGTPFSIQIRGKNSLGNAAPPPMIIVDGVVYPSDALPFVNAPNLGGLLRGGNVLDYLDPAIIESVTILKDADATSVYGSRGAYGVVLITTKRGKSGKPQLTVNAKTGFTERGTSTPLLNTQQYLMLRREALKNDGLTAGPTDLDLNGTWDTTRYTDWQKEFTGALGQKSTANATWSGGANNVNYLIGGNYSVDQSVQRHAGDQKRGGLHFDVNTTTNNKKFSFDLSGFYTSTANSILPIDFTNDINYNLIAPNAPPIFLKNGNINWAPDALGVSFNSVAAGQSIASPFKLISNNTTNNLTSALVLKYSPVNNLNLHAAISYGTINGRQLVAEPSTYFQPGTNYITTSTLNLYSGHSWKFEPNADYTVKMGKGSATATAGMTLTNELTYSESTTGSDFLSDAQLYDPALADTKNIQLGYTQAPKKYLGYFAIINYNWDNKYLLNLSGRYDGSTKFGSNHQFGSFGAVAASWIISEEKFFSALLPVISFMKFRASYGTNGGDNIGNYSYLNTYKSGIQYTGALGLAPNGLANPNLQWEKTLKREVGMNVEFLNGRLSIDAAYYSNQTTNQLLNQPLSTVTGYANQLINSPALIKNYGYEIALNATIIKHRNFTWLSSFNIAGPKSILAKLPGVGVLPNSNYVIGGSLDGIKLFKYAGVDPQTGSYNFYKNGVKGEFTPFAGGALDQVKDRTEFRDLAPKYYGGFQNTFKYKGLTLDILFSFTNRIGENFLGYQSVPYGMFNKNMPVDALHRWQKPGDVTNIPKLTQSIFGFFAQQNFVSSTGAYERATYARLNNLNLSYTLPAQWMRKARITTVNIFLQGQNLMTISKYKNLDPENLGAGLAPLRVYTAGINITL